jgi:hypothetical protein
MLFPSLTIVSVLTSVRGKNSHVPKFQGSEFQAVNRQVTEIRVARKISSFQKCPLKSLGRNNTQTDVISFDMKLSN